MKNTIEALNAFFGGFGWPVYPEDSVPGTKRPPYITVKMIEPNWEGSASFYVRLWDRAATPAAVYEKADEIKRAIGAGACVPLERGVLWIYRDTNLTQRMPYPGDPTLHCVYMSLTMQAITE